MDDLFDTPKDQEQGGGDAGSGWATDLAKSVEDAVGAAGLDPGILPGGMGGGTGDAGGTGGTGGFDPNTFDRPPEDWDAYNAGQAKQREKDIADGLDPTLANIINPDIDPENPDRIN